MSFGRRLFHRAASLVVVGCMIGAAVGTASAATTPTPPGSAPAVAVSTNTAMNTNTAAYAAIPKTLRALQALQADSASAKGDAVSPLTAIGFTSWGRICEYSICIDTGTLMGEVSGSGTYVQWAGGSAATISSLCAWNIDQAWYNKSGVLYAYWSNNSSNYCTGAPAQKYTYGGNMEEGQSCTLLYTDWYNIYIDAVCHTIL